MDTQFPMALYNSMEPPAFNVATTALILAVSLPLTALVGYWTGSRYRAQQIDKGENIDQLAGEATLGAILALLGLLLAFSFGNALTSARIQEATLIDEAATLGTAFARADYLPEPGRTELKAALLDYAQTRLVPIDGTLGSKEKALDFLETSLAAQARLWPLTLKATEDPVAPPIKSLVASAVNDVLDAHHYRMQTIAAAITVYTEAMLYAASLASLFLLGNRSGRMGRSLTWRTFFLSGFLFVVMISIIDTQRGADGLILMNQSAIEITILDMEKALAEQGRG